LSKDKDLGVFTPLPDRVQLNLRLAGCSRGFKHHFVNKPGLLLINAYLWIPKQG